MPPIDNGKLRQIREEWKQFLQAIAYFDNVPIVTEDSDDIQNEAERALGPDKASDQGTAGVMIILMTVTANVSDTGQFGPVFDGIKLVARALENVAVNRGPRGTGKTFEALAEAVAGYTHGQFYPQSASGPMILVQPGITIGNDPNFPCKDAWFNVPGSLARPLPKIDAPAFVVNNGLVTMSVQTPGAAIFYTIDGTRPGTTKNLYLNPVALPAGTKVKAQAWLAGYLASDVACLQL